MNELTLALEALVSAKSYLDVFGPCEAGVKPETHIKMVYRRLARKFHPDKYTREAEKELAQEAFKLLGEFLAKASMAVAGNRYGEIPKVVIKARRNSYEVGEMIRKGEIADLYVANDTAAVFESKLLKIARIPRDNDLMSAEARAIKKLREAGGPEFQVFFPNIYDTFAYRDERAVERRANVMERLTGWYNLEEIREYYPKGILALDMLWIWRRVLWILGFAHSQGILHGAVWPSHVMIFPEQHGVMLVDWCYSQSETDTGFGAIKAISGQYQDWYPLEVVDKQVPTTATDIFMAAKSMVYAMGGETTDQLGESVPRALRAFFMSCLETNQKVRPNNAWELLSETDELLGRIGEPYYPRRFREFSVPSR